MEEPVRKLNLLNSLIPTLMQTFNAEGENKSAVKSVISTIETIREVLEERSILGPKEYATIVSPSDSNQQGVSTTTEKAKASTFICSRLSVLLTHICGNLGKNNVKDVIRMIMPFV